MVLKSILDKVVDIPFSIVITHLLLLVLHEDLVDLIGWIWVGSGWILASMNSKCNEHLLWFRTNLAWSTCSSDKMPLFTWDLYYLGVIHFVLARASIDVQFVALLIYNGDGVGLTIVLNSSKFAVHLQTHRVICWPEGVINQVSVGVHRASLILILDVVFKVNFCADNVGWWSGTFHFIFKNYIC